MTNDNKNCKDGKKDGKDCKDDHRHYDTPLLEHKLQLLNPMTLIYTIKCDIISQCHARGMATHVNL